MSLLTIDNLRVEFGSGKQAFRAVDGVSMHVKRGELIGVVGESGSGKSVSMMALMGLIDPPGQCSADQLLFDGHDLLKMDVKQRRQIIGRDVAMIFQDALTSLNPSYTIGFQIRETLKLHMNLRGAALEKRVLDLLDWVEIPAAKSRINSYPHELSGGMNQRVMIAMAISCEPKLLIADEPTTALDVTIQAQIMELLVRLQKESNMALIMISHDLAIIAEMAQRAYVMYAGQVVEQQPVPNLFDSPTHPYTKALLDAIPEHNKGARRLSALSGLVPGQYNRPQGCLLAPRCAYAQAQCHQHKPPLAQVGIAQTRCFYPLEVGS